MRKLGLLAGALAPALLAGTPAAAEALIWGFSAEQLEYRLGDETDVLAWDFDAFAGSDELRLVWRSEGEYGTDEDEFETLENQLRLHRPISDFWDLAVGIRADTPAGPDRLHGLIGLQGLAPQWFEIDLGLFVSNNPFLRFETEYELLLTNRLILTPSIEAELPLTDDEPIGAGAFGPRVEVGARLSYDLIDRSVSPYLGIHYERLFGESADLARADDEERDALFVVAGLRLRF
jgi:copper resistance protein B